MENKYILKSILLIGIGVASRLIPHPANFTAITGIAIFSGNALIHVSAMIISDLTIGFDSLPMRLAVYGSILAAVWIGKIARRKSSFLTIGKASFVSSLVFFVVTNFAVWKFGSMYSRGIDGLLTSYVLALPFFKNAILGDFFFTGMLFGVQKLSAFNTFGLSVLKRRV